LQGPSFGISDLWVEKEPFNGDKACHANILGWEVYNIAKDKKGRNSLTRLKTNEDNECYFSIAELEVWSVKI
jgi:hypothetical protein